MRSGSHACLSFALLLLLAGGCLHYSQKSSSRSGQAGWGSGGGAGAGDMSGSSSGSGWGHDPRATREPSTQPQYGGVPTAPTGMALDPALGLYRMNDAPDVFFDGRAYYRKAPSGWTARLDPSQPWRPVTVEAVPAALRRF